MNNEHSEDFSFRIRINSSPSASITTDESKLEIPSIGSIPAIIISSEQPNIKLSDAKQLSINGSGFTSESDAEITGLKVKNALTVALARVHVGVDFGERAPKHGMFPYGLRMAEKMFNAERALNNVHGIMVYETRPTPIFVAPDAIIKRGATSDSFISAFGKCLEILPDINNYEALSYQFFNASFFQPKPDIRFLLLVMSIEALNDHRARSKESIQHVETMIEQTRNAPISDIDKITMTSTLSYLKEQSIGQACKRIIIERLGDRKYKDMSAEKFFSLCYGLRSKLVHGISPEKTFKNIQEAVSILEILVSDLLTIPILG